MAHRAGRKQHLERVFHRVTEIQIHPQVALRFRQSQETRRDLAGLFALARLV
jgi:hypothetical protein